MSKSVVHPGYSHEKFRDHVDRRYREIRERKRLRRDLVVVDHGAWFGGD